MKEKKCKLCGQLFIPECPSNVICKRDHFTNCPICKKQIIWNSTAAVQPCSKECKKELTKQKNIAKYGVEHPMQSKEVQKHHRQAMLEKYGVESPLQSEELKQKAIRTNEEKFGTSWALGNKNIKEKSKQTMIERYGGATTLESPVLRKKIEETLIDKYGVDNPMKNEDIQHKASNTCYLKYGVNNPMQVEEIIRKAQETKKSNLELMSDLPTKLTTPFILQNERNAAVSSAFAKALDQRNIKYQEMYHIYNLLIPDQRAVISIDPSATHNTIGNYDAPIGVPKDYHINKTILAREMGYRCVHIFDWDDWDKIADMFLPKKKVHARQCTIYKLNPKVADEFLTRYHLQGTVRGQIVNLGLVKDGELIQVMTFGSPRYDKHYYTELLRLCTKPGYAVIGGSERLFSFATKKLNIDEIISYCDLSKFTGDVYSRIRMKLIRTTEPQEIWSRGDRKITANLLRKHGYDHLFDANEGKGTSNEELMLRDGWLPVFDCGQAVYAYSSTT